MRNLKIPFVIFVCVFAGVVLSSCTTLDRAYRSTETYTEKKRDRHAEPLLTIEITENRFALYSSRLPGFAVFGFSLPASDGRTQLIVTEARVFANWANGWTEGFYEASGLFFLAPRSPFDNADAAALQFGPRQFRIVPVEPIELWSLQRGGIRYYDTYFQGEEGASAVRGRVDRVTALTEWLRTKTDQAYFDPSLFETIEGIPDDSAPEWLIPLRESDSIARDRREAPGLFPLFYNLTHFNEHHVEVLLLEEN